MIEERSLTDQIEDFIKIMDDLQNTDVVLDDEDKGIPLLNIIR